MVRQYSILLGLVALIAVVGCRPKPNVVQGTVTYDGKNVNGGAITLYPQDGKGPSTGATIIDGYYRIEKNLTVGRKRVEIRGPISSGPVPQTTEELMQASASAGSAGPLKTIPIEAGGNNVIVEIIQGEQTRDFPLTSPEDE